MHNGMRPGNLHGMRENLNVISIPILTLYATTAWSEISSSRKDQSPRNKVHITHPARPAPRSPIKEHVSSKACPKLHMLRFSPASALRKTLRGDVLQEVNEYLPESIPLLIHA